MGKVQQTEGKKGSDLQGFKGFDGEEIAEKGNGGGGQRGQVLSGRCMASMDEGRDK